MSVHVEDRGAVRVVTIDRPAVRNAVDGPTAQLLYDVFVDFDGDDAVSVAVLTGGSGTFCAGADLKAISTGTGNTVGREGPAEIVGSLGPMGPTRLVLDKPVIAAVEGHAVAGRTGVGVLGRPSRGGERFDVRGLLPPMGCTADRRWNDPAGAADRPVARPRSRPHRTRRRRCRGGTDRARESGRGARRGARGWPSNWPSEVSANPQVCMRSDRPVAVRPVVDGPRRGARQRGRARLETIATGETAEGAHRFADGRRPPRRPSAEHQSPGRKRASWAPAVAGLAVSAVEC